LNEALIERDVVTAALAKGANPKANEALGYPVLLQPAPGANPVVTGDPATSTAGRVLAATVTAGPSHNGGVSVFAGLSVPHGSPCASEPRVAVRQATRPIPAAA
jgi:hypothetical protein